MLMNEKTIKTMKNCESFPYYFVRNQRIFPLFSIWETVGLGNVADSYLKKMITQTKYLTASRRWYYFIIFYEWTYLFFLYSSKKLGNFTQGRLFLLMNNEAIVKKVKSKF